MLSVNKISVVVALVLAAAVVFILVTPDPTDDVDGVLHIGKQVQVPGLVSALYVALYARERSYVATGPNPETGLLELLCARRC